MPKVSKEYFDNKRKIILDAALKVFSKKPSYTVSMKDIIKDLVYKMIDLQFIPINRTVTDLIHFADHFKDVFLPRDFWNKR